MKKELSVIIPAYNEERAILNTLREAASYLSRAGYRFEIIVVNDGSTDTTLDKARQAAAESPQIRVLTMPRNSGKGEAVKEGIRHAAYPYCLFMDADNSTSIKEWSLFENEFQGGAQAVIGSRHLPASVIVRPQPWIRRFLGGGYRMICHGLFGLSVRDFNCGFKAYQTPIAKKIYAQVLMKDWTFDLEVLCLLKREGILPVEVPVRWEHKEKVSNLKPLRSAAASLRSLALIKKNLRGRIGK